MKTILFQGDSITDGSRKREDPTELGRGYARAWLRGFARIR